MSQLAQQLDTWRLRLATITRDYSPDQPRDGKGRFASGGGSARAASDGRHSHAAATPHADGAHEAHGFAWAQGEMTHISSRTADQLTPEQQAQVDRAFQPYTATSHTVGQCQFCSKLVDGPLAGVKLGFRPDASMNKHIGDVACPDHWYQLLYRSYRNLGRTDAEAHRIALTLVQNHFTPAQIRALSEHGSDLLQPVDRPAPPTQRAQFAAWRMRLAALREAATKADYFDANPKAAKAHAALEKTLAPTTAKSGGKGKSTGATKLVPLTHVAADVLANPYTTPDPFALHQAFGSLQLPSALGRYSLSMLRKVGTPLGITGKSKADLIQQIVAHVTTKDGHIGPSSQAELDKLSSQQRNTRPDLHALRLRLAAITRYEGQEIVRGADGRIIGNISATGGAGKGDMIEHEGHHLLSVKSIHVGLNPREDFNPEKLGELAQSIKENGLLQPISVRPHNGGYQVIAGERRLRASMINGATHVPVIVHDVSDQKAHELALIENISRADMKPGETARAYQNLISRGASVKDIANLTGKTAEHIQQHLALLTLPDHLQRLVDSEKLPMGVVRNLAKLSAKGQEEAASRIITEDLGVKSANRLIRTISERENQISMFDSVQPITATEHAAQAKYEDAVGRMTTMLASLDDASMRQAARAVGSPKQEADRLNLMVKQIQRMQNILEEESFKRKGAPMTETFAQTTPPPKAKRTSSKSGTAKASKPKRVMLPTHQRATIIDLRTRLQRLTA